MKKAAMVLVGAVFIIVGFSGVAVHAAGFNSFRAGTDVAVAKGETVDQTLFTAGNTVDIAGTVNGDVYCAGQSVVVSGTVNGDVLCIGQSVTISGTVNGNVRTAGQTVVISGQVARRAALAGQSVTIDAPGRIAGDISIASAAATVSGAIGRDLNVAGNTAIINGTVGRNILAAVNGVTLGNGSVVGGSIDYTSDQMIMRGAGSRVGGTIARHQPERRHDAGWQVGSLAVGGFWLGFYGLIALLLFALVLGLLFPQALHDATDVAVRAPWRTLLVGFIASIVAPAMIFVLFATIIGIPLALFVLLIWVVMICLSFPLVAYYLGSMLLSKSTHNIIWMLLLGGVIILVLYMIPVIGFLTWLVVLWMGAGIILSHAPRLPRPRYEVDTVPLKSR